MLSLCRSLAMQGSEDSWLASLQSLEAKKSMSRFDSLLLLKSVVSFVTSTQALRNLVQLFLRKIFALMDECDVLSDEKLAQQTLNIVKDFWSLVSNQHVVITQQAYGRYSACLYEVLPSLASVYIDLFIAVHSTKSTVDKAAKRLYSWLMFELNERCIKTALLEACGCTTAGARLVLPVLRTLLSSPSDKTTNLDYLLHFILLKRWSFICTDLCDLIQMSSSIKAPEGFLEWLVQHWPKAVQHLPNDKSLKGQRVSECLLELDRQAVEELIDVFSEALSHEQTSGQECEHTDGVNKKSADQVMTNELFFVDKKGNDTDEVQLKTERQFSKKEQRKTDIKKDVHISDIHVDRTNKRKSNIFMLSGHLDDNSKIKSGNRKQEVETGNNKDTCMDFSFEESANEQTELHKTENMQPFKKKKKLSCIEKDRDNTYIPGLSSDNNISKIQAVPFRNQENPIRETVFTLAVEASKDEVAPEVMDYETDCTWQGTGRVAEGQEEPEIIIVETNSISVHGNVEVKNSRTDKENRGSNNVTLPAKESKTSLKKYKASPKMHRKHADLGTDTNDTSSANIDTQPSSSPQLLSQSCTVLDSDEEKDAAYLNISAYPSSADQICKKNEQHANPKVVIVPVCNFTGTESNGNSRKISGAVQPLKNTDFTTNGEVKTTGSSTEYQVELMLSAIRKSMSGGKKGKPEGKTDTPHVKTRLRTKSENMAQADNLHKTRSRKSLIMTERPAADDLKDWLRQSPSNALKIQSSPQHLMPENQEEIKVQEKSPVVQVDLHKTRNRKSLITTETAADDLKDRLRQSPSGALKKQPSPKCLMPENQEEIKVTKVHSKSPIKKVNVKDSTAIETDSFTSTRELIRDIFGTPLKTYSKKDRKKIAVSKPEDTTLELPTTKHKSPAKASEDSKQRRYFLRTNCSHRLLNADAVCPSCSPTTKS